MDGATYLRARAADADGNKAIAAQGYAAILRVAPDDVLTAARAYRAGLDVGDDALVSQARQILEKAGVAPSDAALLDIADATAAHDRMRFAAAVERLSSSNFDFLAPAIRALDAAPVDPAAALKAIDSANGNQLARRFATEIKPIVQIYAGQNDQAVATLKASAPLGGPNSDIVLTAAQLLADRGARQTALNLLTSTGRSGEEAERALNAGRAATVAHGIADIYLRLAERLDSPKTASAIIVLTRAALRLDPDSDRARLSLAAALANDEAGMQALETLDAIKPGSVQYAAARMVRIAVLQSLGQQKEALGLAAALSTRADASSDDFQRYGDALMAAQDFAGAATAYRHAIDKSDSGADWILYLQYGSALDEAGRWPEAQAALQKAVSLNPKSSTALNYLGYARLEHGEDPVAATKLLEQASALEPDSVAIQDSLGWGYFLQGHVAQALPILERAAAGAPANSTISEHLGDVYWSVGRYYEARYAWRAASVTAEGDDVERLQAKLQQGLPRTVARR